MEFYIFSFIMVQLPSNIQPQFVKKKMCYCDRRCLL